MDSMKTWWIEERVVKTVERLQAHDFKAAYVKTREAAADEVLREIHPGQTVGIGGTLTIREIGVADRLKARGQTVYDHWQAGLTAETILATRKSQMTSDVFLGSANAVTMNGELVNIDGIGNRVNSITFGPGKVILVAGFNKIVENVDEAIKRVKNISSPLNARRLNIDVPCAKLGKCVDCNSPNRICRVLTILERRPTLTDIRILLVAEEIGF